MPDALLPFGPLHILALHLPIGALIAIAFLEFLPGDTKGYKRRYVSRLLLFLVLSTAVTLALGLAYEDFGGYGDEMEAHERWGFIFSGCVLATYLLHLLYRWKQNFKTHLLYNISLLLSIAAVIPAGHTGGESVHGKGFVTKPFNQPEPSRPEPTKNTTSAAPSTAASMDSMNTDANDAMAPTTEQAKQAAAIQAAISPETVQLFNTAHTVFERHCYTCHGATKQKGRYRLDNRADAFTPGKSKRSPITGGQPDASELLARLTLPATHDDVMPPVEKQRVPQEQIDAVREWIAQGAIWPSDDELKIAAATVTEIGDPQTNQLIEQINQTGAKAEYNAWGDNTVRLDLGVVDTDKLDSAIDSLPALADKLVWLDCSKLTLEENAYQRITQLQQLERLHLDSSNVSDNELKGIAQLPKLSYLNLYNTSISDSGLKALAQAPALSKLYLTSTKVTENGIQSLQQAKPKLQIIHQ